ncbi:hypothetical protein PR202_gb29947 [Eleusine coracana subsp. coracana]|uniref:Glutathione peroxidase n=1 Tax=Eleusine coracana subsp. coracana TaxID=191504 RepID=A0AAV5G0M9_ELECO|nr:hypothetical protein PR202_gb29947 [Eleusine coracana subsp. coracana]
MPPRPAPFLSRLRILRGAAAVCLPSSSSSSSAAPSRYRHHHRFACPVGPTPLRARFSRSSFAAVSPLVLRPITAGFALFSMAAASSAASVHDFTVKDASGKDVDLSTYKGKVLLIVNVASQCGLTNSNYTELSQLYEKYKDQGFEVLAFPCNQFGGQEPGTNEEIVQFACTRFKAEYPIFDKVN